MPERSGHILLPHVPPLVQRALDLAQRRGFAHSCIPDVGRLLGVLAGHIQHGVVGEIGTGSGVGAAWMLSHLAATSSFVTIEADAARATDAQQLFRDQPRAQVLHGDWRELLVYGPFDLLFVDAGAAKASPDVSTGGPDAAAEAILQALRPGGMVVLDDLSPEEQWPEEWRGRPDPVRAFWLHDPRVNATEVLTTPRTTAILATRIS